MDRWMAVEIMLNLRVTDPLIGLVLPPQIHLFPIRPRSETGRAAAAVKRTHSHSYDSSVHLRSRSLCSMKRGKVCKADEMKIVLVGLTSALVLEGLVEPETVAAS